MPFLRFYASSCFKYLSVLVFVSFLAACSVSQPGAKLLDNNPVSGNIPATDSGQASNDAPISDSTPAPVDNAKKALKVSWNAPLEREDSSTLELAEIAEYRVYYGASTGVYKHIIVVDGNSTLQVEQSGVPTGKYYVAVTAVDRDGRESGYSQEITITL